MGFDPAMRTHHHTRVRAFQGLRRLQGADEVDPAVVGATDEAGVAADDAGGTGTPADKA
jgi:hypothetical protein